MPARSARVASGGGLAAFLGVAEPRLTVSVVYTGRVKGKLGYELLGAINGRRLDVYGDPGAGDELASARGEVRRERLEQLSKARRELLPGLVMKWLVPESEGHDDLVNTLALLVHAAPLSARRVTTGRRPGGR